MGCTSAKQVSAVPNGEDGRNKAQSNGEILSGEWTGGDGYPCQLSALDTHGCGRYGQKFVSIKIISHRIRFEPCEKVKFVY